jgi:hypothetical protein
MYPQYVEVDNKRYKINTDFRVAIECNRIAEDKTIGDLERGLAVIYALFGDEGIDTPEHYEKLLDLAKKYLLCGKEYDTKRNEKPNMDFIQDYSYITTSFMSDYHIDLDNCEMHWWKFVDLMNGLSNSEFGNCCILNKIRNLRDLDISTIKDAKARKQIMEMKKEVALHKDKKVVSQEQKDRAREIYKKLGIIKEG